MTKGKSLWEGNTIYNSSMFENLKYGSKMTLSTPNIIFTL